jgi:soluble lytic murein transglycosylase
MVKSKISFLVIVLSLILQSCGTAIQLPFSPTKTATLTPTFTITPSPLPTATLTPTPTPQPAARVTQGDQALFEGDYDRALQEFQTALSGAPDAATRVLAMLGMARCQILLGQPSVAITTLSGIIQSFPDSTLLPNVYYFLGNAYQAQDNLPKAIDAYAKYSQLNPGVLDAFINELRGDLLAKSSDPAGALTAYQLALKAPQLGDITPLEIKTGRMYAAMADYKNAIRTYLATYDKTKNEYYKAQIDYLAGQAYLKLDMTEQAFARYQDAVNNYPHPIDTYNCLVALVNAGVNVDELQRGMIDYYAGQYGYAIEAFNRYIQSNPNQDATPYHYKALSLLALDQPGNAVAVWDIVVANFPKDKLWASAFDEKASVQWSILNQFNEAATTYLSFVSKAPSAPEAPAFLFEAARILERKNQFTAAAPIWERIIIEYPTSDNAWRSLFLAGVTYYRVPDLGQALITFQRALVFAATPEEQSAADFWIAKTYQAQGNTTQASAYWEQCTSRDPTGYYSVRAREVLLGQPPMGETVNYALSVDWPTERHLAEGWMRITFNLDHATDLSNPGDLLKDPRFLRGTALWQLGLYEDARVEFESLRTDIQNDAANTYRLIQPLLDMGFNRSAILAARQVLSLAGMDNTATLNAPAYFNHVRFGAYFQDLVLPYAHTEGLDALFVFSVMRQESLFESFASSGAGARGLMQIMPATGQEISHLMSWPATFSPDDLDRPLVSIRLGTRYLARQRDAFDGDLFAALAAYNSGPGNAAIWLDLANKDPDLFVEIVRIQETRTYIQQIYEFANLYRLVYEKNP